jgi:multidrug efflux pump subunit AcrA (membrane-fusion protein)
MKSRILLITILTTLVSVCAAGCSTATPATPGTSTAAAPAAAAAAPGVTAEGRLEPVRYIELSAAANGSVSGLLAAQGDEVQAGQMILQLQTPMAPKAPPPVCTSIPIMRHRLWNYRRPPFLTYVQQCTPVSTGSAPQTAQTLEAAQASAATRLASAHQAEHDTQDELDKFDIPAKFSGMTAAEAARLALTNLESARTQFEPYKADSVQGYRANHNFPWLPASVYVDTQYYKGGLASEYKKQLNSAWLDYRKAVTWLQLESALESAKADVAQAQKDVDSLQDTSMSEATAGARAALANAELRAPFDGTVTNLDLKVGDSVTSGKPIATLADFSSWVVKTTDLTENDVVNIQEGQPVDVTFDAIPGKTLTGTVESISQNYAKKQGDIVYEVTVRLNDKLPEMRWGMTTKLHFPE